jgi:hypothetical protein
MAIHKSKDKERERGTKKNVMYIFVQSKYTSINSKIYLLEHFH